MAQQALLAAKRAEKLADVLHVFRTELPDHAPNFTALRAKLASISDVLTRLDQAARHPQYGASTYRIRHDVNLVIRSLSHTYQTVLDHVGRTRAFSYARVWGDLCHHMQDAEGVPFYGRLALYLALLTADVGIMQEVAPSIDREYVASQLVELLEVQVNLGRQAPAMIGSPIESPISPISPLRSPDGIRPAAPEVPMSPLSPTWTADSTMTLDSSHTSYSSMTSTPPPPHWAREVFDGAYPSTPFRHGYESSQKTRCDGNTHPDALHRLQRDGFHRALELQFDNEVVWVRLYHRPGDGRARLLFMTSRTNYHCIPLTRLKAIRNRSELQLCQVTSDGNLERWALLNFASFERLVLFYSTFVAMKRQDKGDMIDEILHETEDELRERVLFHGQIRDGTMVHALRLLQDGASGVLRLEASPLRGSMAAVPLWTAFVTKYKRNGDQDWATLRKKHGSQVLLAALKPEPYVFLDGYTPPRKGHDWLLDFVERDDALIFIRIWVGLCRGS